MCDPPGRLWGRLLEAADSGRPGGRGRSGVAPLRQSQKRRSRVAGGGAGALCDAATAAPRLGSAHRHVPASQHTIFYFVSEKQTECINHSP